MAGNWTEAQQKVIDTRDKNIFVSAAAGSGKTAVLVERIIQRLMDEKNPIDVDKLLVVTFTNAAAAEMRERVLGAIDRELEKNPDNLHLQKQQAYIHNAKITTIHSFCLNLIKENFNKTNLDPGARVADDTEIKLLKSDVVKEVIEEFYKEKTPEFINFVTQFEKGNYDKNIEEMILKLYEKAISHPWPERWLDSCVKKYEYSNVEEFENSDYVKFVMYYTGNILEDFCRQYKRVIKICDEEGIDKYRDFIQDELAYIQDAAAAASYEERKLKLNFEFVKAANLTKKDGTPELRDVLKDVRKNVKDNTSKIKEKFFTKTLEEEWAMSGECKNIVETCVLIVKKFKAEFEAKKRELNIIDFNDFEQYAIRLLVEEKDGEYIPTELADELAKEYQEVMIDEYQDSNEVQETILKSVSGIRMGKNNRFMVGDVKQSIYGFRGADPSIFVEKYNTYKSDEDSENKKIILDKNFRSRTQVIDTTNYIFERVMSREFGGIDYDDENKLYYGNGYGELPEEYAGRENYDSEFLILNMSGSGVENEKDEIENTDSKINGTSKDSASKDDLNTEDKPLTTEEDEELTKFQSQARMIAQKVEELTDENHGMVIFDKEKKIYRPLKYSDIAILMRSVGDDAQAIVNEFTAKNIPVYLNNKSGYFQTPEIVGIVNYLKIIDNPNQDLPLASVLKSNMFRLTDEALAKIRISGGRTKNISLYQNVKDYAEGKAEVIENAERYGLEFDETLAEKLREFLEELNEFRDEVSYLTIYDLICDVMRKTGYMELIMTMPLPEKRIANINMLKQKAADYEKGSYKGLFNFIRYIEKIDKYEINLGEASSVSENDNTVRIMTIHKSKGLEFPVVFIATVNKKFNSMDSAGNLICQDKLGIGIPYFDSKLRVNHNTIIKNAINEQIKLNNIEEELRIFYVACTRAREKLIFTGVADDLEKFRKIVKNTDNKDGYMGYANVSKINSYMDILGMTLGRPIENLKNFEDNKECCVENILKVKYLYLSDIFEKNIKENLLTDNAEETLKKINGTENSDGIEKINERLSYIYPYDEATKTNAKMSVSEIKKISYDLVGEKIKNSTEDGQGVEDEEMTDFSLSPGIMGIGKIEKAELDAVNTEIKSTEINAEKIDSEKSAFERRKNAEQAMARGSAVHKVFEVLDYNLPMDKTSIENYLLKLKNEKILDDTEYNAINPYIFVNFAKTRLYERMKKAFINGSLKREQQFVMGLYQSEVDEFKRISLKIGETGETFEPVEVEKTGDIILLQGIIDAFFIEDNKIILVDYKTDRASQDKELVSQYYVQMQLYKKAICQITGYEIEEIYLYSTSMSKEVKV